MLGDMAEEFEQYQRFDEDSAEQVREVLRHRELTPIESAAALINSAA